VPAITYFALLHALVPVFNILGLKWICQRVWAALEGVLNKYHFSEGFISKDKSGLAALPLLVHYLS